MSLIEFGYRAGKFLRWARNGAKGEINDHDYELNSSKIKFISYNTRTIFLGIFGYCFILVSDLYLFSSLYVTSLFFFLVYGISGYQWYKRRKSKVKK